MNQGLPNVVGYDVLWAGLLFEFHRDGGYNGRSVQSVEEKKLSRLMGLVRGHQEIDCLGSSSDPLSFVGMSTTSSSMGSKVAVHGWNGGWGGGWRG